mgnify:CR=1 FL=1
MKSLNKMVIEILNNVGAISKNRALSIEEISRETKVNVESLRKALEELRDMGYVEFITRDRQRRYFLTPTGILVALSSYS